MSDTATKVQDIRVGDHLRDLGVVHDIRVLNSGGNGQPIRIGFDVARWDQERRQVARDYVSLAGTWPIEREATHVNRLNFELERMRRG